MGFIADIFSKSRAEEGREEYDAERSAENEDRETVENEEPEEEERDTSPASSPMHSSGERDTASSPKSPMHSEGTRSHSVPRPSREIPVTRTTSEPTTASSLQNAAARRDQNILWNLTDYLIYNPEYIVTFRGILHIAELICGVLIVAMLGSSCEVRSIMGFSCPVTETFMFVLACGCTLTALLIFICCALSKQSAHALYHTNFELGYYAMYCIMFLIGSLTLHVNVVTYVGSGTRSAAAWFGIFNTIFYFLSFLWFLLSHRYDERASVTVEP